MTNIHIWDSQTKCLILSAVGQFRWDRDPPCGPAGNSVQQTVLAVLAVRYAHSIRFLSVSDRLPFRTLRLAINTGRSLSRTRVSDRCLVYIPAFVAPLDGPFRPLLPVTVRIF